VNPAVSVVIVNWNASRELAGCLGSLIEHHSQLDLRITVVDNASTDGSVEMIRNKFPGVGIIENRENRGFAAANNQAFAVPGKSDFVLVLNPDIFFVQSTLEILIDFFTERPDVHVLTPRILGPEGRLQAGCRRRDPEPLSMLARLLGLDLIFPRSRKFAGYTYGDVPEDRVHEIQAASGSFLFMRRKVLDKVGGFDERFFLYAEDLDWCLRVREEGFSIYYYPAASVFHLKGASSVKRPLKSQWYLHYTAFLYLEKNRASDYPLILRMLLYFFLAIHFIPAALWSLAGSAVVRFGKTKENR